MISVLITAYKEPNTIGKAIESFVNDFTKNKFKEYEILVAAPDDETLKVVESCSRKHKHVKGIKDSGNGKPNALNLLFGHAKGDILILSDGDVYIEEGAVNKLLDGFNNPKIGAVSGRPISINQRDNMLGYWSHLLTDAGAHLTRQQRVAQGKFIVCTGYLYAIRNVIQKIPEDALSDDAVISYMIWQKGYQINYAPEARVYIKYPTTFKDWITQKTRSAGGYTQLKKYFNNHDMPIPIIRSFSKEVFFGTYKALAYARNVKELCWTSLLFLARIYLWTNIFITLTIKKKSFQETWKRIESTK